MIAGDRLRLYQDPDDEPEDEPSAWNLAMRAIIWTILGINAGLGLVMLAQWLFS